MRARFSAPTKVNRVFWMESTTSLSFKSSDACRTYELTWAIREASERLNRLKLNLSPTGELSQAMVEDEDDVISPTFTADTVSSHGELKTPFRLSFGPVFKDILPATSAAEEAEDVWKLSSSAQRASAKVYLLLLKL